MDDCNAPYELVWCENLRLGLSAIEWEVPARASRGNTSTSPSLIRGDETSCADDWEPGNLESKEIQAEIDDVPLKGAIGAHPCPGEQATLRKTQPRDLGA
ncbi:hypothetical protein CCUS01_12675 [Colletotrichum cuscutae]|uniref:Uncharacterized protein n=1 Tax=Colletotrichum cuscutae TaxID=1209917 RepID=A0AAI9XEI6_9PEZI|nr:hypothetical protein CCUS01_12675 [Colletotrichum cuscutae]